MPAPEVIKQLVAKFEENREAYRSGKYNEARLRQEFLDKFFIALGWDVYNEHGLAPEYAEVVVEDSLEIEGTSKAPDYAFKVGRERKFYVEAKKPRVDIQYDIHPAYQLRRYAWNAHMPLSVLTDFEELAIYNCKAKPNPNDSAATGRDLFYRYTDYVEKWDEIAGILSKDAVWRGAFDRYAESSKGKKGTTEVDDEFLKDMSEWRNELARNIALRNPQVADEAQLNYAVQMTIDRIIFLRICEDRGIEPEEQLKSMASKAGIYAQLVELFKRADVKYNSGLFHFSKEKGNSNAADTFTPGLKIDDKVLKEIINSIYYPCPYIFKEIPVEILGQVYEQFLGKVIRLTPGHQAKVEEKPEVRKAGGVYYTPRYIVDYIVTNTVGKLLEGKTPEEAEKLKIVDPACGSGSFLLGAYQHLLDWHLKWYTENDPEKWAKGKNPALVQVTGGYKLTTEKKKEILVNNIHGVDIDAQAVEVTKLSLLLKVLEEESGQLSLGFERVLPDLGKNIQCGNSLIGEDYFEGRLTVEPEERKRVNPFEWERAFPEVFQQGGFDAVIGNPPWISLTGKFGNEICSQSQIQYLITQFNGNSYMPNMYEYFVAQGINLVKVDGLFSFIVPDRLGFNSQFVNLRKRILSETKINILLYKPPFPNITADTLIFVFTKSKNNLDHRIVVSEFKKGKIYRLQNDYSTDETLKFFYYENPEAEQVISKIETSMTRPLIYFFQTTSGFGGKSTLITPNRVNDKQIAVIKGDSINRYRFIKTYYFVFEKKNITGRTTDKQKLGAIPKILLRKTGDKIIATYDDSGVYPEQSLYFLFNKTAKMNCLYFLGVLNSKLLNKYFQTKSLTNKNSIAQVKKVDLDKLPIRDIDFLNTTDLSGHDMIVSLVTRMLDLHKLTPATPQEQERLAREIASTDREIDRLVYELYGLTEEEIRIVEGG